MRMDFCYTLHLMNYEGEPILLAEIEKRQESIRQRYGNITKAAESVLQIAPYKNGDNDGLASGVVIDTRHILTASHVVRGADDFVYYMNANGLRLSTPFAAAVQS